MSDKYTVGILDEGNIKAFRKNIDKILGFVPNEQLVLKEHLKQATDELLDIITKTHKFELDEDELRQRQEIITRLSTECMKLFEQCINSIPSKEIVEQRKILTSRIDQIVSLLPQIASYIPREIRNSSQKNYTREITSIEEKEIYDKYQFKDALYSDDELQELTNLSKTLSDHLSYKNPHKNSVEEGLQWIILTAKLHKEGKCTSDSEPTPKNRHLYDLNENGEFRKEGGFFVKKLTVGSGESEILQMSSTQKRLMDKLSSAIKEEPNKDNVAVLLKTFPRVSYLSNCLVPNFNYHLAQQKLNVASFISKNPTNVVNIDNKIIDEAFTKLDSILNTLHSELKTKEERKKKYKLNLDSLSNIIQDAKKELSKINKVQSSDFIEHFFNSLNKQLYDNSTAIRNNIEQGGNFYKRGSKKNIVEEQFELLYKTLEETKKSLTKNIEDQIINKPLVTLAQEPIQAPSYEPFSEGTETFTREDSGEFSTARGTIRSESTDNLEYQDSSDDETEEKVLVSEVEHIFEGQRQKIEALEIENSSQKENITQLVEENQTLISENSTLQSRIDSVEKKLQFQKSGIETAKQEPSEKNLEIDVLNEKVQQLEQAKSQNEEDSQAQIKKLEQEKQQLDGKLREFETKQQEFVKEIESKGKELETAQNSIQELEKSKSENLQTSQDQIRQLQQDNEQQGIQLNEKTRQFDASQQQLEERDTELGTAQNRITELEQQLQTSAQEKIELEGRLAQANNRAPVVEEIAVENAPVIPVAVEISPSDKVMNTYFNEVIKTNIRPATEKYITHLLKELRGYTGNKEIDVRKYDAEQVLNDTIDKPKYKELVDKYKHALTLHANLTNETKDPVNNLADFYANLDKKINEENDKTLSSHRSSGAQRFFAFAGAALSVLVTGLLPGIIAMMILPAIPNAKNAFAINSKGASFVKEAKSSIGKALDGNGFFKPKEQYGDLFKAEQEAQSTNENQPPRGTSNPQQQ